MQVLGKSSRPIRLFDFPNLLLLSVTYFMMPAVYDSLKSRGLSSSKAWRVRLIQKLRLEMLTTNSCRYPLSCQLSCCFFARLGPSSCAKILPQENGKTASHPRHQQSPSMKSKNQDHHRKASKKSPAQRRRKPRSLFKRSRPAMARPVLGQCCEWRRSRGQA